MAEIVIRKNTRGPQRYRYVVLEGKVRVIESKQYRSRSNAVRAARTFIIVVKQGVDFHE